LIIWSFETLFQKNSCQKMFFIGTKGLFFSPPVFILLHWIIFLHVWCQWGLIGFRGCGTAPNFIQNSFHGKIVEWKKEREKTWTKIRLHFNWKSNYFSLVIISYTFFWVLMVKSSDWLCFVSLLIVKKFHPGIRVLMVNFHLGFFQSRQEG